MCRICLCLNLNTIVDDMLIENENICNLTNGAVNMLPIHSSQKNIEENRKNAKDEKHNQRRRKTQKKTQEPNLTNILPNFQFRKENRKR